MNLPDFSIRAGSLSRDCRALLYAHGNGGTVPEIQDIEIFWGVHIWVICVNRLVFRLETEST